MMVPRSELTEERVLVLLPPGQDLSFANSVLEQAGLASQRCADGEVFCRELEAGAGAALLAEETLTEPTMRLLVEALGRQPPWSDFPLVAFFGSGGETVQSSLRMLAMLEPLGNVSLLERPIRTLPLVSALQAALR